MPTVAFRLKAWLIEQTCLFELTWGQGQQLTTQLTYPKTLTHLYHTWQQAYLNFYKSALRARTSWSGTLAAPPIDWRAKLVQAEAQLLSEFHHWLHSAELLNIRKAIAQAASHQDQSVTAVDVFFTCDAPDLIRLPWEAWEIGTEFAATKPIRLSRTPSNIQAEPVNRNRQGKMRILAILGDETGLDFRQDRAAVQSLQPMAEIHFVGWQPGTDTTLLRATIARAIADPKGWDILFFAGHSNETVLTGGELAIAPNESMLVQELARHLAIAKEHGLQFAIFNSCNGLSVAQRLIDLGFSQVAVMREPIHNQVAEEFLIRFVRSLAELNDVQEALLAARQYLKLEKHLTYPSAYLVPSLFRHPEAPLFRPQPFRWQQRLKQWLPTKREAVALSLLMALSVYSPVQDWLLDQRVRMQAMYRQLTQPQQTTAPPPIVVVQIDDQTIQKQKIEQVDPMERRVIAQLIDRLVELDAKVIGIDYLLDRHTRSDPNLQSALAKAVQQKQTWFTFAARQKHEHWYSVLDEIAKPTWALKGDMWVPFWHVRPLPWQETTPPPLAYQLAMTQRLEHLRLQQPGTQKLPQPSLTNSESLQLQVKEAIARLDPDYQLTHRSMYLQPITVFSYSFKQRWLQPILDFSIPPTQVYLKVPAWQLLEDADTWLQAQRLSSLKSTIVILAPGGYDEAGIAAEGEDNFPLPPAIASWHRALKPSGTQGVFTGGEAHAYMTHHFLKQHFVIPIPDLWAILVAALIGKGAFLWLAADQRRQVLLAFVGVVVVYGGTSLFLYQNNQLMLPIALPFLTICFYSSPHIFKKNHG